MGVLNEDALLVALALDAVGDLQWDRLAVGSTQLDPDEETHAPDLRHLGDRSERLSETVQNRTFLPTDVVRHFLPGQCRQGGRCSGTGDRVAIGAGTVREVSATRDIEAGVHALVDQDGPQRRRGVCRAHGSCVGPVC